MRTILLCKLDSRALAPLRIPRDLTSRSFIRFKTSGQSSRHVKEKFVPSRIPQTAPKTAPPRQTSAAATNHAKTVIRRGPPEKILIYHGGTGKTVFLGMLRLTTIFIFGVSTVVVAPSFFADEFPSWLAPAIVVGGTLPMLFVAYTAAPFVTNIYLYLPVFARKSREEALKYARDLPPSATLHIGTLKATTIPRISEVQLSNLVPSKSFLRPVSFRNTSPAKLPWWRGGTLTEFYTTEKSKTAKGTPQFYPEVWESVYNKIQENAK
ncbi:hypothetical protein VTN31DRAFT_4547 [Thermomyces dupontii]|uniref:uncharacterized protein n=1 Tax=Talaromyces thermophilus TaxID=28565 RepID=UPI003743DD97